MKSYYVKQRNNPQLGVYYVKMGQMTKKDARAHGKSIYGSNTMLEFKTLAEYETFVESLEKEGQRIS